MKSNHFEIFDKFYNAHWFLTGYSCRHFSVLLQEGGNRSISKFIGVMENDVNSMIFDVAQFSQAADYYSDKLINDHGWRTRLYKAHESDLEKYFRLGENFRKLPFKSITDKQIIVAVRPLVKLQELVRVQGVMLNGLVIDGRSHLSNKIRSELRGFFSSQDEFEKYWVVLTQVTKLSMTQKKETEISKLGQKSKQRSPVEILQSLKKIHQKYCWLNYMYYGPPANLQSFQKELRQANKSDSKLGLKEGLVEIASRQGAVMKKFKFSRRAKHLVWLAQRVLWQKSWRKDVEYHAFYCYEPMFKEIARRKKELDWKNLLYMFPWELENFIIHNKPSLAELKQRRKYSVLVVSGPKKIRLLTGQKARKYFIDLNIQEKFAGIRELKGQSAFHGLARGKVCIVQVPADMKKMRKGDILVSQATSPDLLPAIRLAAAIVTNTGGLICHAAIISRELKIPCVVGTIGATTVFKDGDLIEVDASRGIVKKV